MTINGNDSLGVQSSNSAYPIYETSPQYDLWLKLILGGTLAFTLVLGIWLLSVDVVGALVALGVTIFDALLFHAVLPRRYQIFENRVRIVLGWPFSFNIPLSTIKEGRPASGSKAFAYWGIRFATSSRSVVEIIRHKGWNIVISPANRGLFLEQLTQAIEAMSEKRTN
jgi:hypothetical protein